MNYHLSAIQCGIGTENWKITQPSQHAFSHSSGDVIYSRQNHNCATAFVGNLYLASIALYTLHEYDRGYSNDTSFPIYFYQNLQKWKLWYIKKKRLWTCNGCKLHNTFQSLSILQVPDQIAYRYYKFEISCLSIQVRDQSAYRYYKFEIKLHIECDSNLLIILPC